MKPGDKVGVYEDCNDNHYHVIGYFVGIAPTEDETYLLIRLDDGNFIHVSTDKARYIGEE